jgi:DNA-binding response OmpR family regulator
MSRGRRILLVEDDRSIARLLELELGHRGFDVRCVFDGLDALPAVDAFAPDAIVLDILLPGMDGEQILARLRRAGNATPVIMLTARDRVADKVRNLETGADDYLTKPFEIDELVARLGAVMRRTSAGERLRVGTLVVDPGARTAHLDGEPLDLTAREFDLLALLAANAPNVVSRATMLDRVWRATAAEHPNIVDVYIGYLRRKLQSTGAPEIATVRGIGFSLRG